MTTDQAPRRIFLTTDAVGGVWTYTLDVARGFAARGAIVDIAVLGPAPDPVQHAEAQSIPGATLIDTSQPLEWCMTWAAVLEQCAECLAALAARRGATTIHLHSPSLLGNAGWPAPVLATVHSCAATWWRAVKGDTPLPEALTLQAAATRHGLNFAAVVVAPTHAFAAAVRETYALARSVTVVRNGSRAFPCAPAARRRGVLAAGRLWDEGKNIAAVDRAARSARVPVFAAGALTGPNGARATLHHTKALGQLSGAQLKSLMAETLVFAAPALYEPFGLAILEAAQTGMALVLGDIPSLRELWDGAAIFVDPADHFALADAVTRLHEAPRLAALMSAKARVRAEHYALGKTVSALWDLHEHTGSAPALKVA